MGIWPIAFEPMKHLMISASLASSASGPESPASRMTMSEASVGLIWRGVRLPHDATEVQTTISRHRAMERGHMASSKGPRVPGIALTAGSAEVNAVLGAGRRAWPMPGMSGGLGGPFGSNRVQFRSRERPLPLHHGLERRGAGDGLP